MVIVNDCIYRFTGGLALNRFESFQVSPSKAFGLRPPVGSIRAPFSLRAVEHDDEDVDSIDMGKENAHEEGYHALG